MTGVKEAPARQVGRRCEGCAHAFHRDQCPRKGPSRCLPRLDKQGRQIGTACFQARPPCPCPFGECHECNAPIAGVSTLPLDDGSLEVDIDRGSANTPDGDWIVWQLPDGRLAGRPRQPGEQPGEREWTAHGHVHQLAGVAAWGVT